MLEYMGGVITTDEMDRRLEAKMEVKDKVHYIMELPKDDKKVSYYIDAEEYGNHARFINHSCDPYCQAEKWVMNNQMHKCQMHDGG